MFRMHVHPAQGDQWESCSCWNSPCHGDLWGETGCPGHGFWGTTNGAACILTCSWSSASRWARSSSESSVELSLSEELSLLLSLDEGGATTLVGGGTAGEDTATTGSSGSSGILAKRISNTSWWGRSHAHEGSQVPRHVWQGAAWDVAQHHHSVLGC